MEGSSVGQDPEHGALVYIVGASGVGKDTLIGWARQQIASRHPDLPVAFAHRYITRSSGGSTESHIPLEENEFSNLDTAGMFALSWGSLGTRYGIGIEIDLWRAAGLTVVINGSRAHLPTVAERYPGVRPVLISASSDVVRRRLQSRGRDDPAAIEARLRRTETIRVEHPALARVDNSGPVEAGGARLLALLKAITAVGKRH